MPQAMHPDDLPGARYSSLSVQQEREEEIAELVVELLNIAVENLRSGPLKYQQCYMCGGMDKHRERCPVPTLEQYINPTERR